MPTVAEQIPKVGDLVQVRSRRWLVEEVVPQRLIRFRDLSPSGQMLEARATITLQESGFSYILADLHAADNGSVIVSFVRNHGFGSPNYLYANKISSSGQLMWGSGHVHVEDSDSLQFGEFPYFTYDGNGGAVFGWYTNSPLQSWAQHILSNGTEAFPHNGSAGAITGTDVRVSPTVSYNPTTQETFLVWTEEDSLQGIQWPVHGLCN